VDIGKEEVHRAKIAQAIGDTEGPVRNGPSTEYETEFGAVVRDGSSQFRSWLHEVVG
jgi:hypothetical protein